MRRRVVVGVCALLAVWCPYVVLAQAPTPAPGDEGWEKRESCFAEANKLWLSCVDEYPYPTEGPEAKPTKGDPSKGDDPTPTARAPQSWGQAVDSTPLPTPANPWLGADPHQPTRGFGSHFRVPLWRLDLNNDGYIDSGDQGSLNLYVAYLSTRVDFATPVYPTATSPATCTPAPTYTPEPTCVPGGGPCAVTEAQGAEFVNGVNTVAIFLGIVAACGVAGVAGLVLLFFKGR